MFTIKPLESSPLKASISALNAREFFKELYPNNTLDFSRSMKKVKSMFTQGLDFVELSTCAKPVQNLVNTGKNHNRKDYAISIEVAKHMALMSRTENGRKYRQYLIDFEAKSIPSYEIEDPIKRAKRWIEEWKATEPKVFHYDNLVKLDCHISISDFAKSQGIGVNKFREYLYDNYILMRGRNRHEKGKPYQKYINNGMMTVKYKKDLAGKNVPTTWITPLGSEHFARLIKEDTL